MDDNRFDALTRMLATRNDRRHVLRTLGAGIAVATGALRLGEAEAKPGNNGNAKGKGNNKGQNCGAPGKPCKWNKQCCEFAGLICIDGACGCPENTCSDGSCADACTNGKLFDPDACVCECPEETCENGTCHDACTSPAIFDAHSCLCIDP